MAKIFLSYRRQDSAGIAGRIYDRLRAHFGDDAVFMDIDSIPFGVDFRKHIDAAVSRCDLVLAVIGTKWAGEADAHRRIDDPGDFVRIELESALRREIPVIPILIDRTKMPTEAELPSSLAGLTYRNAIDVDQGRDFHPHVDRLVQGIEFHFQRAKIPAASPVSQSREAAASTASIAQELERHQDVVPTEPGQRSKPAPMVEPRTDCPPTSPDPRPHSKAEPQSPDGLERAARSIPAGVIKSENLPKQTQAVPDRPVQASSTKLEGPRPKRPPIARIWLYAAALPLLAILGGIAYVVTIQRRQEPLPNPRFVPNQSPTEPTADNKAASASHSEARQSKPASSPHHVESSDPSMPQPGREWTNSIGMKLVRIEAGDLLMGTTKDQFDRLMRLFPDSKREYFNDEQPQHPVKISRSFFLGIHEVTQGQYQAVMGNNPSKFKESDDLPVESVSWLDAVGFCNNLSAREKRTPFHRNNGIEVTLIGGNGYRLPTEAEWEYACRAKSATLYPFGDDASNLGKHAWYTSNAEGKTHLVGQKLPNDWGLYDMLGNAREWCADGYDEKYYVSSPPADPPGAVGTSRRVIRGGSWDMLPRGCRPAYRDGRAPAYRGNLGLGFRVAVVQD